MFHQYFFSIFCTPCKIWTSGESKVREKVCDHPQHIPRVENTQPYICWRLKKPRSYI